MVGYNLTAIATNSTGMLGFVKGVNNVLMFGWLGVLFLIILFVVMISSFVYLTNDFRKSLMASSFLTLLFTIFMKATDLLPDTAFFIALVVCALSLGFTFIGDN